MGAVQRQYLGGIKRADYPSFSVFPGLRTQRIDETITYGASIGVPGLSYAGFTPVVQINGSIANSNFDRFTRDSFSAGLTLQSRF
mgnify:CR=1 FL=1